jgi:hypothetical protein
MIWPIDLTRFRVVPNHVRDGLEHSIGCLFEVDNVLCNMVECDEILTKVLSFAGGLNCVLSHRKFEAMMIGVVDLPVPTLLPDGQWPRPARRAEGAGLTERPEVGRRVLGGYRATRGW